MTTVAKYINACPLVTIENPCCWLIVFPELVHLATKQALRSDE